MGSPNWRTTSSIITSNPLRAGRPAGLASSTARRPLAPRAPLQPSRRSRSREVDAWLQLSPTLPLQTGANVFIAPARHVHVESGQEPELRTGQSVEAVVEVSNHERQGWRGGVTVSLAHVLCG